MNFEPLHFQFDTRELAETTLNELSQLAEDNGFVSFATFVMQVGRIPAEDDHLYGWKDLDAAVVYPIGNKFYIHLSQPSQIKYFYQGGLNNE